MIGQILRHGVLGLLFVLMLAGCTSAPTSEPVETTSSRGLMCPRNAVVPNASYVGPYYGVENNIPSSAFAQDIECAERFKAQKFKHGFITVFGSSRIGEHNTPRTDKASDKAISAANDLLYSQVMLFAKTWSDRHGTPDGYPILTGAGPGIMEAATRGAQAGSGVAIGYTTYYDFPTNAQTADPNKFYIGDAVNAFTRYPSGSDGKDITTDGLIFSSIAMREYAMIKHSAAIIIAPGGTGTQWEIFQTLETLKSYQLRQVPIYFVGNRQLYWATLDEQIKGMKITGALKDDAFKSLRIEYVENPVDVVEKLEKALGIQ